MIDKQLLPLRVMLDSSALVAGLDVSSKDPSAKVCRAILDTCLSSSRVLLLAAPALAEMLRGPTAAALPRIGRLAVVAFDDQCAEILARRAPKDAIKSWRAGGARPAAGIKFDAMIAACAARHCAQVFISADAQQRRIALAMGCPAKAPTDLLSKQTTLLDDA